MSPPTLSARASSSPKSRSRSGRACASASSAARRAFRSSCWSATRNMREHKERHRIYLALLLSASLVQLVAITGIASAQITTDTPTQSELLRLPAAEQGIRLAEVVRRTQQNRKCARARTSLEKTFDDGAGGWLVRCEEGQD